MTTDFWVSCRPTTETDRGEWEDLVDRSAIIPGFSQRFDCSVVDAQEGIQSLFIAVRTREGQLVGGARVTVQRRFPSRYLEMLGGPVFLQGHEDTARALVSKALRESVRVIDRGQFRPTAGHPWHLDQFGLHRTNVPAETVLVDLARTEDELWRGVDHSVRQGVRKAKDHGVTFRELTTESEIERAYPLIERFGHQRDFAAITKTRLLATQRIFHPVGRSFVFLCEAGSEPAAVSVVLLTNQRASLLVVASAPEFAKLQVTSLLDWESMRFSRARGATSFDFLGLPPAGTGLDGLRRFKLKWGGTVVGGEEYLEGVVFRLATSLVRRWPGLSHSVLMNRGPPTPGRM